MSVQDIIFAAGGSSTTTSTKYYVGVYDLPITANWSALVYTGDKTVIVGDNKFVTITDPADQSTMVYGDLPVSVFNTFRLSYVSNTVMMASNLSTKEPIYSGFPYTQWQKTPVLSNSTVRAIDVVPDKVSPNRFVILSIYGAQTFVTRDFYEISTNKILRNGAASYYVVSSLGVTLSSDRLPPKFNKYSIKLNSTTPTNSYAYRKLNGVDQYVYIGNDGFLYESTDGTNYIKNTATVIPTGTYLDITVAGGKFCAPIANTNKFVVIG